MDNLHERLISAHMPVLVSYAPRTFSDESRARTLANVSDQECMESAELHAILRCTESLAKDEPFCLSENQSVHSDHSTEKPLNMSMPKVSPARAKPTKRASKPRNAPSGPRERKSMKNPDTPRKRQPRAKKVPDEPIFEETIQVDNQSVIPLKDVVGDLEFEDLEAEDLELLRYLPSPGNIEIVDSCAKSLAELCDFQRKLRQLHEPDKDMFQHEMDHDSDATISIVSENGPQDAHSAMTNPTHDMAMLMTYKHIFDPPVPAVVTIPTYMVTVQSTADWETETKALQHLVNKAERSHLADPPQPSRSRKRKQMDDPNHEEQINQYVKRLITAIEIKSNQVVNMKRSIFSLQKSVNEPKKREQQSKVVTEKPETVRVEQKPSDLDAVSKARTLISKFDLDPFCADILMACLTSVDHNHAKELVKFHKQHAALENELVRKDAYGDQACQKDLHIAVMDTQKKLCQLRYAKERSVAVVNEKYVLDVDEIEKRTNSSTERAKSHVTNMFEENRRQFDLQRTLDFATCKCDVFAINTRNMRRRGEMQPQHYARLFEDIPTANNTSGNPGSPPHTSQSNLPTQSSHSVKRRRNNFASSVKEVLEEREIYDDLSNINRMLKEDPTRSLSVIKSADVIPDNNRLMIDGKPFHRNQEVLVEHHVEGKFTGSLLQFSQTEIMIKRCGDGQRLRFPLGLVMDKKIVLKKKMSPTRGIQNGPAK
ncbi:uncharacterized protein LOC129588150 [Paramacrobiotus metropolitanus]|uniref:uncharacterized protein LOC129588150 n=1 Tax=Paramacrobiotus metropolitanus TaxID=2943436 RepID=UPI002445ECEB|nr:uncharacterized protein LOC129588150 [Paramacrobiotus metropolitanus]